MPTTADKKSGLGMVRLGKYNRISGFSWFARPTSHSWVWPRIRKHRRIQEHTHEYMQIS